jgi:hypothetical protein
MPSAASFGTTVPLVDVGDGHVSTVVKPGFFPHFVTPLRKSRAGPGLVGTVVVVVVADVVVVVVAEVFFAFLALAGTEVVVVVVAEVFFAFLALAGTEVVVVVATGTGLPGSCSRVFEIDAPSISR